MPMSSFRCIPGLAALLTCAALMSTAPGWAAPAAEAWILWDQSDESSTQPVDYALWQSLLDDYLIERDDGRTLFRYHTVSAQARGRLDAFIAALASIDPRTRSRAEQLPYWINLYNALTVRVVLDHPAEDSIRSMGGGWFRSGPWNDQLITIAGQPITLNDIEHRILRPLWKDPRIHYAVNCASVSCPNLAPEPYTRDNSQRLLDSGESQYLHHPRGLRFDQQGQLHLSSIYEWYLADFGGSRDSLLAYLADRRPDLAERLSGYRQQIRYHYDWSLNDAE
jgi:hypothetical protein